MVERTSSFKYEGINCIKWWTSQEDLFVDIVEVWKSELLVLVGNMSLMIVVALKFFWLWPIVVRNGFYIAFDICIVYVYIFIRNRLYINKYVYCMYMHIHKWIILITCVRFWYFLISIMLLKMLSWTSKLISCSVFAADWTSG